MEVYYSGEMESPFFTVAVVFVLTDVLGAMVSLSSGSRWVLYGMWVRNKNVFSVFFFFFRLAFISLNFS